MCLEFGASTIKIKVGLWCNGEKWGSQGKNLNTLRNFVTDAFVYYICSCKGSRNNKCYVVKEPNQAWECYMGM